MSSSLSNSTNRNSTSSRNGGPGPGPGGPGKKKKKKHTSGGNNSSSSGSSVVPLTPEQGDYIINWHLQYCASIFLQNETQLTALSDLIKAELMKIKTDGEFIKENLSGPHTHLLRLKNEDRDLRSILDSINNLSDLFRVAAQRAANRIL